MPHSRLSARARAALAVTSVLLLAACGSQLDPATVAQVNGSGVAVGADGQPIGEDGAVVPGADGGTTTADGGSGATAGDSSGSSSGDSSSAGGDTGGGGTTSGSGENAADGGVKAGSCEGFKNGPGITEDKIVIANASDISGPVPGIFEAAQQGTRAYAAYFNSSNDICGRKLDVLALDSRSDAGGDQQAYTKACESAFAAVGSMSAYDSGGARTAEACGLPDIRSHMVTPDRNNCATCYSAMSVNPSLVPAAVPNYWTKENKEATQNAAILYVNVGAAAVNAEKWRKGWGSVGWKINYFQPIDTSEFNYAPYVQQLKDKGIKLVVYTGPYQFTVKLQDAMRQQGYEPDVFMQDLTIYDQNYVEQAGENGDGSYVYSTIDLFDNTRNQEMVLYRSWLDQVSPGAIPNVYGLYAWSATRLFVQQALALGGKLSRESLLQSIKGVKDWTGNGLHVPQQVGAKTTPDCMKMIQLNDGKWSQVSPGNYLCDRLLDVS